MSNNVVVFDFKRGIFLLNKGFDETWLEQLKAKNDIISVMSRYFSLQQKGKNYWACCPFHHEKTPSFCVNGYEQFYHCFGCKEHGDVITFIQKMESCDFMTAVEILAKNANMEIPSFYMDDSIKEKKKSKDTILKILDIASKHYEENLYKKTSVKAQDYVKKRKLTKKELDKFHIGYSTDWTEMLTYLKSKGFKEEEMVLAGIANHKDGRYYDTMGERLIFPIYNIHDECIGFSARSLVPTDYAKYKNSANNLVFDKSKNLYGINIVRKLKQEQNINYIIIVEGQMDVIALNQAGFCNCVACLGTALTPLHARMIKNICNNVIVSLDGDFAGQKATIRTIDTLVSEGLNVRAIKIPENLDPDEYIKKYGKQEYQKLLDNAVDFVEFKIMNKLEQFDLNKVDEKAKFVKSAIDIVNELNTNSEKQVYLDVIKKLSGVPTDVLRRDLIDKKEENLNQQQQSVVYTEDAEIKSIKFILASLCYKKDYANFDFDLKKYLVNPSYIKLYETLKEYNDKNEKFLISYIYDLFDVDNEPNIKDIINYNFELIDNAKIYYNECIWKVRENYLKSMIKNLSEQSMKIDDTQKRLDTLKQIGELQKKLRNKILED